MHFFFRYDTIKAMKVILIKDVSGLGRKYDVKDVSDGYAHNFLIARKLAEPATLKKIEATKVKEKQVEQLKKVDENILEKNLQALEGLKVSIEEKANEKGHLFSGIHKEEIIKILKEKNHIEIPEGLIDLEQPIKETGEHKISVLPLGRKSKGREFTLEVLPK